LNGHKKNMVLEEGGGHSVGKEGKGIRGTDQLSFCIRAELIAGGDDPKGRKERAEMKILKGSQREGEGVIGQRRGPLCEKNKLFSGKKCCGLTYTGAKTKKTGGGGERHNREPGGNHSYTSQT